MDSERAEAYLRLLAERELRRAREPARAADPSPIRLAAVALVSRVAHALVIAGALDTAVGQAIVAEMALALQTRLAPPPPRSGSRPMRWWPASPLRAARSAPVPPHVIAIGLTVPIAEGTLFVLSYLRTAHRTGFVVVARTARIDPLNGLTARDEAGTRYQLAFTGGSGSGEWTGELILHPDPPPGLRWLEITGPGLPAQRVDLVAGPGPDCLTAPTVTEQTVTEQTVPDPGEHLLHALAAELLAHLKHFSPEERRALAAKSWEPSSHTGLGEVVRALEAAGALSVDSEIAGQLAALHEAAGIHDHGLTVPSGQELPAPWASVLSQFQSQEPLAKPPDGCAGLALTLPELQGMVISVTGLSTADGTSTLHVHATGVASFPVHGGTDPLPLIWLRDSTGRWHLTSSNGGSFGRGELTLRLTVTPPLARPDWIELVVRGQSAEVRATVQLRWG